MTDLINQWNNYGGDCRTAPAAPGLLNIFKTLSLPNHKSLHFERIFIPHHVSHVTCNVSPEAEGCNKNPPIGRLCSKGRSWRRLKFNIYGNNIPFRSLQLNDFFLLFVMEIYQIICHFGFFVFLSWMLSRIYDNLMTGQSAKLARKKYNIAKIISNFDYFHYKIKKPFKRRFLKAIFLPHVLN